MPSVLKDLSIKNTRVPEKLPQKENGDQSVSVPLCFQLALKNSVRNRLHDYMITFTALLPCFLITSWPSVGLAISIPCML